MVDRHRNISTFFVSSSAIFDLVAVLFVVPLGPRGGGGVLPEKLARGVRPASQNPYPIYDQNLRYSLPYL